MSNDLDLQNYMDMPNTRAEEMEREIADISSMLGANDNHLNTVPESIFVGLILPFVAGEKELPAPMSIETMVKMAGGPYKETIVVDTNGVELFKIPSVYDPEGYNPILNKEGLTSIQHVIITAQQMHTASPPDAQRYLNMNLAPRRARMTGESHLQEFARRWNELAVRYGRPPIFDTVQSTAAEEGKTNAVVANADWDLA